MRPHKPEPRKFRLQRGRKASPIPKLKVEDDELDIDELEEAEYSEDGGDFEPYDGPLPPKGTILVGLVKKVWWTYTKNDDPMLKILFVADDNVGDKAKYNGCPIWENAALTAGSKFRWKPFLDVMGLTIAMVKKNTTISSEEESNGDPIEKIGKWSPGGDEAWCRILTAREKYLDEWTARVGKWLEYEEPEEDEDDEDVADEPEDEADTPEEETTKPARGSGGRRAAKPAATTAAPATRSRRQPAAKAATSTTKPARGRGRSGKAADTDNEPPF
jgi:hypothetical protein